MKNKKFTAVLLVVVLLSVTCGVIFADSISSAVLSVVNRFTAAVDSTGADITNSSQEEMDNSAIEAKQKINNILASTDEEVRTELKEYKDAEIIKRNQEIDSLVNDIEVSVKEKKVQKLDEYKQKIDESINKEYNKLLKDLIDGN
jgi:dipeptidase